MIKADFEHLRCNIQVTRANHLVNHMTVEKCVWSELLPFPRLCSQFLHNSVCETCWAEYMSWLCEKIEIQSLTISILQYRVLKFIKFQWQFICHFIRATHLVNHITVGKYVWSELLPFQRLCNQFLHNSVSETCWADKPICHDCLQNLRYSHLQAQFLNKDLKFIKFQCQFICVSVIS